MKYKVSVIKLITLVMTIGLAVAMVACQAATPKPAEKGDPGAQGPAGEQGPPGTTDNEPPMATNNFEKVYLALKGTGAMASKTGIDLSKYFMDAENAALTYKATSSNEAAATVEVKAGMLSVMGKGAGSATITVNAYDGVSTESAESSFDVEVVASNVAPSVTVVSGTSGGGANLASYTALSANLYSEIEVTVKMDVDAGVAAGAKDAVTFNAIMGAKDADDDVVSVKVAEKAGKPGEFVITLTPKNSGRQTVYLLMEDKFGAEEWDEALSFVAMVNTVPTRDDDLPAGKLYLTGDGRNDETYTLSDYFVLTEKAKSGISTTYANDSDLAAAGAMTRGQKYVANRDTEVPADLDTAITDATCTATMDDPSIATVGNGTTTGGLVTLTGTNVAAGTFTATAVKEGSTVLTIVCRDIEGGASGTAAITVRR